MDIYKVGNTLPRVEFAYKPTRRRFLHAALTVPTAASMLPLLLPNEGKANTEGFPSGVIPEHAIQFTTPDKKDPGHKLVVIFMQGGLSFFDTFDPKTHSPFNQIETNAKGVHVTEILSPLANQMDKFIIVNNLFSEIDSHPGSGAIVLTGSSKIINNDSSFYAKTVYTNPFIKFSELLTSQASKDIGYVVLHQNTVEPFGFKRSFPEPWGATKFQDTEAIYSAFDTKKGGFVNPFAKNPDLCSERFRNRMELLETLDYHGHTLTGSSVERRDRVYHKAKSLMVGDFNTTFDLTSEPTENIERYGDTTVGKQFLLGRRMLERGARVVCLNDGNYDNHESLEGNMRFMIPRFAKALSALMDDIQKIDEKVFVAIVTEFGRTATITKKKGRDHWPNAFGMLVGGNCVDGGRVIGKTDESGKIKGNAFHASLVGETLINLLGLGRFETRGDVITEKRFPFINLGV